MASVDTPAARSEAAYGDFEEGRIKHLELIQAVIARLSNEGFVVKGWALTIVGALLGLAVTARNSELALVGLVPAVAFWGLDASLLRAERQFRALYSQVCAHADDVPPFFMAATTESLAANASGARRVDSWAKTALRPILLIFYMALIAATALGSILICRL